MTAAAHSTRPAAGRHHALEEPGSCRSGVREVGFPLDSEGRVDPARLDRDDVWDRMVKPGARLPSAALIEADLGPIHLDRLLRTGPIVLVFFPYASSEPANAALADYERRLAPALAETDAHLVAVSPQIPARLVDLKRRHDLSYFVAADPRHQLITAFNLGFHAPGADKLLGAGRSVLPFPAVVIADRTGVVRFADIRPDGTAHPDPALVLAAVRALA